MEMESVEQPLPPMPSMDMFGGRQSMDADSLRYTLDPEESLNQIRHYLNAEELDPETGTWKRDFSTEPLMTRQGVNAYIGHLRVYVDKDNMLSNLTPERINVFMKGLGKQIRPFIATKYRDYKIEKFNFQKISLMTKDRIELTLRRAEKNGERLRLMSQMQHVVSEQKIEDNTRKKKMMGLFG